MPLTGLPAQVPQDRAEIEKLGFDFVVRDPEGDVPVKVLRSTSDDIVNWFAWLPKGRSHTPGTRTGECRVTIVEGRGFFHLDGRSCIYYAGSSFLIVAGVAHGFSHVEEPTLFIKNMQIKP